MARQQSGKTIVRLLVLIVIAALAFVGVAAFRTGPPPSVSIKAELPGIGKRTPVHIAVSEPKRGLGRVKVEFVQGDRSDLLEQREHLPLEPWQFWGPRVETEEIDVEVGSETLTGLKEGKASIRVTASRAGSILRRLAPVVRDLELDVVLRPPTLQVMSTRTYVAQGGSEAVVYRVGETSVVDGVEAGDWWFPGFPLPGGDERDRFVLFGVPFDMPDAGKVKLVARDSVGNEARASFIERFTPRPFRNDEIRITDGFMSKVVPAILDQTPGLTDKGNLLDNYLMLNNEVRAANAATLTELAGKSRPEFLWREHFMQMRNAAVMSNFADRRTYVYNGSIVDQQDHLGFDLASTKMAPIQAANDGVVVLARYFGIYGNAVVIDHGYGLMSLYGHLSNLSVEEGHEVKRGDVIGQSGATGLAGGDHLHFTVLLRGLSVNPQEWWDSHWIEDRLKLKLGAAIPFGS